MDQRRILKATNADELRRDIFLDFSTHGLHDYHVIIQYENYNIELDIASSPGGSEEGGYDTTSIRAAIKNTADFIFAIFPEDFINRIGKLFGAQDVLLGYPEFDSNLIVKTNNADRLKTIFADNEIRRVFQSLSGYSLKIDRDDNNEIAYLHFRMQRGISNPSELEKVFNAFCHVLDSINQQKLV
jgi:hypothetical protein